MREKEGGRFADVILKGLKFYKRDLFRISWKQR
jgi:hypothetical protein